MKKYFLLAIIVCSCAILFAQTNNQVVIGTIDSVQSKILNEKRKVWVYVPNSGQEGLFAPVHYPVVYLLDGDAHFYSVVGMIRQLSQVNGNTICPEMIVVGIPNTNRTRDLTPTKSAIDPPYIGDNMASISGGGEQFMSFIEKELIPHIDSTYSTSPFRLLIGHSFGGLTVMNTVINHSKLFNAYISIDPSMWWNKNNFLKTVETSLSNKDFSGKALYLGIANTMEEGMDINKVKSDTSIDTRHIRSILEMDDFIKSNQPKGLRYASKYYGNDDHGSVPLIAEYDALRFIFEKYKFNLSPQYIFDTTINIAAIIKKHYDEEVSTIFGYKVKPPESFINSFGYQLLQMKQFTKAGGFFKMNVDNYPSSSNVFDSYGDYFMAIGNKEQAIENFKKSLSIKETPETKRKLEGLMK